MLMIRLARVGAPKHPFYHVVVTNSRNARNGRFIERVGYYNPVTQKKDEVCLQLKTDRIDYWKNHGAQLSERVASLVRDFSRGFTTEAAKPKKAKRLPKETASAEETDTTPAAKESEAAPASKASEDKSPETTPQEAKLADQQPPKANAKSEENPSKDAPEAPSES